MKYGFEKARASAAYEHESGADRWIVSYADFITLLFAFFVVMYSISSVNDGKFRVLAEMLPEVFNDVDRSGEAPNSAVVIDLGGRTIETLRNLATLESVVDEQETDLLSEADPIEIEPNATVQERIEQAIEPLIDLEGVNVRDGQQWVEVELPNELLFASGATQLSPAALPVLKRMAASLDGVDSAIRVEGYTDNVPISGGVISSNWQLSAVRAGAVVEQFTRSGLQPVQMSAVGYGEFYPVADNNSEQGRAQNRRVVVAVAKHDDLIGGKPISRTNLNSGNQGLELESLRKVTRLPSYIGIY